MSLTKSTPPCPPIRLVLLRWNTYLKSIYIFNFPLLTTDISCFSKIQSWPDFFRRPGTVSCYVKPHNGYLDFQLSKSHMTSFDNPEEFSWTGLKCDVLFAR